MLKNTIIKMRISRNVSNLSRAIWISKEKWVTKLLKFSASMKWTSISRNCRICKSSWISETSKFWWSSPNWRSLMNQSCISCGMILKSRLFMPRKRLRFWRRNLMRSVIRLILKKKCCIVLPITCYQNSKISTTHQATDQLKSKKLSSKLECFER